MDRKRPCYDNNRNRNSNSAVSKSSNFEIPGFYYDEEKKRYFKIQPNHQQQTNIVTNDIIKNKRREDELMKNIKKIKKTNLIKDVLFNSELGIHDRGYLYDERNNYYLSKLTRKACFELSDLPNKISHISTFKCEQTPDYVYFLLNSFQRSTNEYMVNFFRVSKTLDTFIDGSIMKISEVDTHESSPFEMSSMPAYVQDNEYLVKTTLNQDSTSSINIMKLYLFSNQISQRVLLQKSILKYNLSNNDYWCTALNSCFYTNKIFTKLSIGFTDHAEVVNNLSPTTNIFINTFNSGVFCQRFHPIDNETLIYNGCKKKMIFGHDLRNSTKKSNDYIIKLDHKSCVTDFLFSKKNYNYLFSTDYTGEIYLWDLRMNKIICNYTGNVNQNSKHKLNLSECEKYLYTVGQDGNTRFWETNTSRLIKTILTPKPIAGYNLYADIPNLYLIDNLNLIYIINKDIEFFLCK